MYRLMFDHMDREETQIRCFDFTYVVIQDHHRFGILLLEMRIQGFNLVSIRDSDDVELSLATMFQQEIKNHRVSFSKVA